MKEIIINFLRKCQFSFDNGYLLLATKPTNLSDFKELNGVNFLDVWKLYSEDDKDELIKEVFIVR